MALTNVLLLSQIAGYVMGLILSLCVVVPMSMHQDEFNYENIPIPDMGLIGARSRQLATNKERPMPNSGMRQAVHRGHCLLFSQGTWEPDGQITMQWASTAYCNYVIVVGVIMFTVCCVQIYRLSMFMYAGTDSSFLSAFAEATGCVLLCVLAVSAAVVVTLGFINWCQVIELRFPSCETAAGQDIDKKDKISTNSFYIEIGSVQFGAWAAFATWVGLAVFSTLKVCRYHQLENIQVSMYRERQRLVNESGSPSANEGRSTPPILTP